MLNVIIIELILLRNNICIIIIGLIMCMGGFRVGWGRGVLIDMIWLLEICFNVFCEFKYVLDFFFWKKFVRFVYDVNMFYVINNEYNMNRYYIIILY